MVHRISPTHAALFVCGLWLLAANARGAEEPCPSLERLLPDALATGLRPAKVEFFRAGLCPAEDSGAVDPAAFAQAVDVSSAWIRAILTDDEMVPDLAQRMVGLVSATKGRDATIADFTTDRYHIVAIQTTGNIGMLLVPIDRQGAGEGREAADPQDYLRTAITRALRHAPAILYLGRLTLTPYGAALEYDDELRDERGEPLSIEEHRRIAALPQPQQTEAIRIYDELRSARLRDTDPTLPEVFVGGVRNYWWGLVSAATDGDVVVIFASKGYGGKTEPISISDWFRADKVEPTGRRKFTAPGPPRDDSTGAGS